MGAGNYNVNVNVNTPGQEKLEQMRDVIMKTSQQAAISTRDFQTWSNAMALAVNAGYSYNDALGKVQSTLKKASIDVSAFTSLLRDNARAQTEAINEVSRNADKYESIAARIGGRILGNVSGLPGGGFVGSGIAQSLGLTGGAGVALGAGAAGILGAVELDKLINATAKYAQEQRNLATELGTTAQFTQILGRVSEVTGVNITGVISSLEKMAKTVADGGEESRKAERAFAQLGLSATEAFKKPDEQLQDVIDALKKVSDQGERTRLVVALLGESGRQILPLVDSFDRVKQAVTDSGVIIDRDGIKKMVEYQEAVKTMGLAWDALGHKLALGIVGSINIIQDIIQNPSVVGDFHGGVGGGSALVEGVIAKTGPRNGLDIENERQLTNRISISRTIKQSGQSPIERLRGELKELQDQEKVDNEAFVSGRGNQGDLQKSADAVRAKEKEIEALQHHGGLTELQRQQKAFNELKDKPLTPESAIRLSGELPDRFNLLANDSTFQAFAAFTNSVADPLRRAQEGERNPDNGRLILDRLKRETEKDAETQEKARQQRNDRFDKTNISNTFNDSKELIGSQLKGVEAQTSLDTALRTGQIDSLKYSLSPDAFKRLQLANVISNTNQQATFKADAAGSESIAALFASNASPLGSRERESYSRQAEAKDLESKTLLIDAQIKSVDAVNKFNESIDEAGQHLRDQISGSITSLINGAQSGRGARGFGQALKGVAVQQEDHIIKNVVDLGLQHLGVGAPGSGPNPNSTFGKILAGTILGGVGQKVGSPEVIDNTNALKELTNTLKGGGGRGGGTGGGGGLGSVGLDGLPITGITGSTNGTYGSVLSGISSAESVASPVLSALSGGGGTNAIVSSVGKSLSTLGSILGGPAVASKVGIGAIINGTAGVSTEQAVGIGLGLAAAGGAAYQGISTIAKGGAKNVAGGLSEGLGAAAGVAALFGPAGLPVALGLGIASAVTGLVGSFLKDPKQARTDALNAELSTAQYQAPVSLNVTQSTGGKFGSFDARGNFRQSNLSAIPTVSEPSIFTQTHGLFGGPPTYYDVPGRIITPYSGTGGGTGQAPVAGGGTTIIIHGGVSAIDTQTFHDAILKHSASVGAAVTKHAYSGDTPMHGAIKFLTGTT